LSKKTSINHQSTINQPSINHQSTINTYQYHQSTTRNQHFPHHLRHFCSSSVPQFPECFCQALDAGAMDASGLSQFRRDGDFHQNMGDEKPIEKPFFKRQKMEIFFELDKNDRTEY